jgi:hypothetical protein
MKKICEENKLPIPSNDVQQKFIDSLLIGVQEKKTENELVRIGFQLLLGQENEKKEVLKKT